MDTIGTKPEEDESYNNALALLFSVLGCVVGFSVLEWIFYYLYNNKVSKIGHFLILPILKRSIFSSTTHG